MATRRQMLTGLAASAVVPGRSWAAVGAPAAVSAAMRLDGKHVLVGLKATGALTFEIPLPARGHAAAAHPAQAEIVAIARRPGTFAMVIDCTNGAVLQRLKAPQGRHFYGHAAFSTDGTHLFTTENAYDSGEGRIGVWDRTRAYQRVGEFASGGIGPHEIIRLPNGNLVVANGGIRTHPATGRDKLNLDTMRSNLTLLTPSGEIADQALVPEAQHLNSLRHIAVQSDGTVGCGCQWQGDVFEVPALVAVYRGSGQLDFVEMAEADLRSYQGYIGSVGTLGRSHFVVTAPRGGRLAIVSSQRALTGGHSAVDVCGVTARSHDTTLVTDGTGRLYRLNLSQFDELAQYPLAFDNHLIALPATPH